MKVLQTYRVNGTATTRRHECPKCTLVATSITALINTEPVRGQGALALSKKLNTDSGLLLKLKNLLHV